MIRTRTAGTALTAGLAAVLVAALAAPVAAQTRSRCNEDIARLRKAETELPKVSVAPPGDKQIVCITLETNLLFARRLAAHLKECPKSPFMRNRDAWVRARAAYTAQFAERGCKPTIREPRS